MRRIEALTAKGARHHARANANLVQSAADVLRTSAADILDRVEALQENLKKAERALSDAQKKLALGGTPAPRRRRPRPSTAPPLSAAPSRALRPRTCAASSTRRRRSSARASWRWCCKGEDGKGTVAVGVTDDLVGKFSAAELIKLATVALGGQGGGGRPDMAQGGGPDGAKADAAIAAIRAAL